eukprot:CAMPEP_0201722610 /NCGR_PEP_ID=MMETSP0593-20130828/6930_1 /ASSEMBLY_ACC=CAM_ASM_000672 /TAXON_ID=267983 /ORGANISM="Skeletonema japonicum, Strain CCMP2506" /LENGTH=391 /DNA_ID=CAMNT_0048213589 /DNA_START=46 /DNA_END=1218 /DNA_ORIENTATION=-
MTFLIRLPVWLLCLFPASISCFTHHHAIRSQHSIAAFTQKQQQCHAISSGLSIKDRRGCTVLNAAKRRGGAMSRRKTQESTTKGFDSEATSTTSKQTTTIPASKPNTIYSMPSLYDLAFGYRCYEEEVEFLLDAHDKYSTSEKNGPIRILELAAGPARHSLMALSEHPPSSVESVVALDLSEEMVKYGIENAEHELGSAGGRRDGFDYVCGDMRDFTGGLSSSSAKKTKFDTAWILLGSMSHLLTNDDVIRCFSSLRSALKPGATVVVELPHPRETFSMGECTRNGWTVPLVEDEDEEYGELNIVWGDEDDEFDPIAQVRHFTVAMSLKVNNPEDIPKEDPLFLQMDGDGKTEVKEIVPMRLFTLQEIDALARCAELEMVAKYGALDEEVA